MDKSIIINDDGKIVDILSGTILEDKPEERVRQKYLKILVEEYGYDKRQMAREVGIFYGRNELKDINVQSTKSYRRL